MQIRRTTSVYAVLAAAAAGVLTAACHPARPVITEITSQGSEATLNRGVTVQSGVKVKITFIVALNPDCTVVPGSDVRIVKAPASGKLSLRSADDFAFFPEKNPRAACNTKRVPGQLVEYQSRPGFVGQDEIAYDHFMAGGALLHHKVTINVRP